MVIAKNINSIRKYLQTAAKLKAMIGFVPTMGALHQGHISLIKRAKKECGLVIVSILLIQLSLVQRKITISIRE